MCGIAGIFGRPGRADVEAMLAALVHRGPDDEHVVGDASFALGTRRLAIQDVAAGRQPMCNERGSVWAALNGEIYNYPVLAAGLKGHHALHTHCDTEVLPHLYEDLGSGLVRTLDGMFAIAVWDAARREGFLARDRVGKKPLYWTIHCGCLCFASEIGALFRIKDLPRRMCPQAIHDFLCLKHVPHPLTAFDGIQMLPPGHLLHFTAEGGVRLEPYWEPDFSVDASLASATDDELVDELIARLRQAVDRRLLSDVPIGFFLSGGIDSSLVTALAAERSASLQTFALVYAGDATTPAKEEDRRWARDVASRLGTDHHEETVTIDAFSESMPHVIEAFGEPFAGVVSTWHLAQCIGRHVKVALSGDGADELFGSYLSHRLAQPLAEAAGWRAPDGSTMAPSGPDRDVFERLRGLSEWDWRRRLHVFTDEELAPLLAPGVFRLELTSAERLRQELALVRAGDPLNRMLELEFRHQLPDQVLTFVDRLSMAHSVEVRAPYLDAALVEFVGRIPGWRKMPNGRAKHLLKLAASRYLPPALVDRPKEGFVMPAAAWLGRLEPWLRDTLAPARLARHGCFRPEAVTAAIDAAIAAPASARLVNRPLALASFQLWWERFFG